MCVLCPRIGRVSYLIHVSLRPYVLTTSGDNEKCLPWLPCVCEVRVYLHTFVYIIYNLAFGNKSSLANVLPAYLPLLPSRKAVLFRCIYCRTCHLTRSNDMSRWLEIIERRINMSHLMADETTVEI